MGSALSRRTLINAGLTCYLAKSTGVHAQSPDPNLEDLIMQIESDASLDINSIGHNELNETLVAGLETAPLRGPKSNTKISDDAIRLIVASEVSSKTAYNKSYKAPIWPKGMSGVTIGIGYDTGYVKPKELELDWRGYVSDLQISALQVACGERGPDARDLLPSIKDLSIEWSVAYSQFKSEMIPRYVGLVERTLDNTSQLSPDSLGSLVSLAYNRGASFDLKGDRYYEMREIADAMEVGDKESLARIPEYIMAMKRLWGADLRGLWIRRDAEAKLFKRGLS